MVSIGLEWQQLLWNCYHHGRKIRKDDSEILELLGNYLFLEKPQDTGFPLHNSPETVKEFLNNMKKGLYDIPGYMIKGEALHDYVNSFNDNNQIYCSDADMVETENPFVYTYPERILHTLYNTSSTPMDPDLEFRNQFKTIVNRLNENPGSNRAVATLYHPGLDYYRTDIPCLNHIQATIRDEKLELHCLFRSNDLYGAWPSNMYLLTFLGLWLKEELDHDVCFNGIHYHSSSLHIYKTDLPAVKKILGEKK